MPRLPKPLSPNDHIIFFPTAASQNPDGTWRVPIHGWVFRPMEVSRLRRAALKATTFLLHRRIPRDGIAKPLFRQRAASFLADNLRGNRIQILLEDSLHTLKRSRPNGHFETHLNLSVRTPAPQLSFCAQTADADPRRFQGCIHCLAPTGVSVISDIDDTIKVTDVLSRRAMLRNTFLKRFVSVPEMAALYRRWQRERDAAFHYISASPWHLYPFLADFLTANDFPPGTFHLRHLRLMPRDLPESLRPGRRTKLRHARDLFRRFPQRTFILVGDSGESDPAIYARLACQFPRQVERIYIRDITGKTSATAPWQRLCRRLPNGLIHLFHSPAEIIH